MENNWMSARSTGGMSFFTKTRRSRRARLERGEPVALSRVASNLPPELESLIERTIGCLLAVHRVLGPGLNEGAYARATRIELTNRCIRYESEKPILLYYQHKLICTQR